MATFWTRADYDAASAHDDAIRARDAVHGATPSTPLERLVNDFGVEAAFKMWAASRRLSRRSHAVTVALTARNDAIADAKEAIADAKEARLARRAAAVAVAEARATLALVRAAEARARA